MIRKLLFILTISAAFLQAVELPIANKYNIEIENGEFTVFNFPFEIKKTFSSGFLLAKESKNLKKIKTDSSFVIDPRTKKKVEKKAKIIQIKQGKKSITFLPKARGDFKIIVWGYEKYPLMFDITVTDKLESKERKEYSYFYKFIDYSQDLKKADKFETDPHEKIIVKLIRSIYRKKLPAGYENTRVAEKFEDEFFEYTLNFSYKGKKYTAEEWMIKNNTNKKVKLYEEMFAKDGVYAVAFENDLIEKDKTTRMFIIKKSNR